MKTDLIYITSNNNSITLKIIVFNMTNGNPDINLSALTLTLSAFLHIIIRLLLTDQ